MVDQLDKKYTNYCHKYCYGVAGNCTDAFGLHKNFKTKKMQRLELMHYTKFDPGD